MDPENPWDRTAVDMAGPYLVYPYRKDFDRAEMKLEGYLPSWGSSYDRKALLRNNAKKRVPDGPIPQVDLKGIKMTRIKTWIVLFTC